MNDYKVTITIESNEEMETMEFWVEADSFKKAKKEKCESWVVTGKGCIITCPKCGERLELCYPDGTEVRYLPYCPWCGEKLKK